MHDRVVDALAITGTLLVSMESTSSSSAGVSDGGPRLVELVAPALRVIVRHECDRVTTAAANAKGSPTEG